MEEVAERGMVDITIVNNMLYLHAMAFEEARIDGLVLPLYDKYNLEYNVYTYEVLV